MACVTTLALWSSLTVTLIVVFCLQHPELPRLEGVVQQLRPAPPQHVPLEFDSESEEEEVIDEGSRRANGTAARSHEFVLRGVLSMRVVPTRTNKTMTMLYRPRMRHETTCLCIFLQFLSTQYNRYTTYLYNQIRGRAQLCSMSEKEFDVLIVGATGFTGSRIARLLLESNISCLLACRRPDALRTTMRSWASTKTKFSIAECDVTSPEQLSRVCGRVKVCVNCVGPFRLHGEAVVAACVEQGCDYVDITGEPEFMEKMRLKYVFVYRHADSPSAKCSQIPCSS